MYVAPPTIMFVNRDCVTRTHIYIYMYICILTRKWFPLRGERKVKLFDVHALRRT